MPPFRDLDKELVEVGEVEFFRPTLAALRAMKQATGRDKDRIDLAELDAIEDAD